MTIEDCIVSNLDSSDKDIEMPDSDTTGDESSMKFPIDVESSGSCECVNASVVRDALLTWRNVDEGSDA